MARSERALRAIVACLVIAWGAGEVDVAEIETALKAKAELLVKIKVQVESQYATFNATTPSMTSCFGAAGLIKGKSLSGCGSELPASLSPQCDAKLGGTPACECTGKKFVNHIAIKTRPTDVDASAELRGANVACFAGGGPLLEKFKEVSAFSDNTHKLMYFGSVVSCCSDRGM